MEIKLHAKTDTANESVKKLTCWDTASNPQCLRIEITSEIHLFPYGYFQHAKLGRAGNQDVLEIHFQDQVAIIKGKRLESLCAALERLAVERIRMRPEKYEGLGKSDGVVEDIQIKEIKEIGKEKSAQ